MHIKTKTHLQVILFLIEEGREMGGRGRKMGERGRNVSLYPLPTMTSILFLGGRPLNC